MPRIAMRDYNTSFFHIMVQGIRKEYIFNENNDINTYLKLIYKYIQKYNVKIIAYCIMNNHAHLLIYVEEIKELSEEGAYTTTLLNLLLTEDEFKKKYESIKSKPVQEKETLLTRVCKAIKDIFK